MSSRDYPRCTIEVFGHQLLESGDLDPLYIAARNLADPTLSKWLVAYWYTYHAGLSAWIADHPAFWEALRVVAYDEGAPPVGGPKWPRGHERRHWRGKNARESWDSLVAQKRPPVGLVADLCVGRPDEIAFSDLRARVMAWRGFGPWIAFKVGDMIDRLGLARVEFDQSEVFMFDDPREAALMLWRTKMGYGPEVQPKEPARVIREVVEYLTHEFRDHLAPPLEDRRVGLQEVETVLCKWKSHMRGFYPLMNDIREIRNGLAAWAPHSTTANQLLHAMPEDR